MNSKIAVCVLGLLLALTNYSPAEESTQATLVVRGGKIWTGNTEQPWAEAVAIAGDRILAVGEEEEIARFIQEGVKVLDAKGGLVTPGWIDSHVHLFQGGENLAGVQLRDATTKEEFVRRIGEFADSRPAGEWITGGDWDHTLWGGELPDRNWIDAVTPNHPVWIQRLDGHMALANSMALKRAEVDNEATAPEGGVIGRGDDGRLTGIFRDNALTLVNRVTPSATTKQMLDSLNAANDYLLERGVTSVAHMGTLKQIRLLRAARARGDLRVRVHAAAPLSRWRLLVEEIKRDGPGDEWLRLGGLKGFVDGSLGSHTAALLEPYLDAPRDRGLLVNTSEDLFAWTVAADAAGLQVMVHAIGDRAIRLQLDLFEQVAKQNGERDRRFRIEHAQHIAPDDLPRFAKLDVIPSMQPYHAIDDGRWATGFIGEERSKTTYAFRSLIDLGVRPAFGSDWFVAPATPLEGIYAAVTRRTLDGKRPGGWIPEQKITVEEALRAYTVDAAYAIFAEKEKGQIAPGKLADLVVVDRNLFQIDPIEIREAKVVTTIVGGRVAFQLSDKREE